MYVIYIDYGYNYETRNNFNGKSYYQNKGPFRKIEYNQPTSAYPPQPYPTKIITNKNKIQKIEKKKNKKKFTGSKEINLELESVLFNNPSLLINFEEYDKIPVSISGENPPEMIAEFTESLLGSELWENIRKLNYNKPTPIQKFSIPAGINHRDLMASAQTGSGKTAGYFFPIIKNMLEEGPLPNIAYNNSGCVMPTALVLVPTRELADQVSIEGMKFCYKTGINIVVIHGGVSSKEQWNNMIRGCDIMVATPGRLIDILYHYNISLKGVEYLVLDEADRMLDMGFIPQVEEILNNFELSKSHTTFMFSATFPDSINSLARNFLHNYLFATVGRIGSCAIHINQEFYYVTEGEKFNYLKDLLHRIEDGRILIFVDMKKQVNHVYEKLNSKGFTAVCIHGDRTQDERTSALSSFKSGEVSILVATDVASRGLDIPDVNYVINYDLPNNIDDYVHRIGRTGRAGNVGNAIALYTDQNNILIPHLIKILKENKQRIPDFFYYSEPYSSYNRNKIGYGGYKTYRKKTSSEVSQPPVISDSKNLTSTSTFKSINDAW